MKNAQLAGKSPAVLYSNLTSTLIRTLCDRLELLSVPSGIRPDQR